MVSKINYQKKVTRDALAYVASISRDRSNFTIPANVESKGEEISHVSIDSSFDTEKQQ